MLFIEDGKIYLKDGFEEKEIARFNENIPLSQRDMAEEGMKEAFYYSDNLSLFIHCLDERYNTVEAKCIINELKKFRDMELTHYTGGAV